MFIFYCAQRTLGNEFWRQGELTGFVPKTGEEAVV